ncbi:MarR family winged helix-turn-helix transcriptional regulator [Latilactobacillus fragifolii]|nr:MarR family winged helix-turn-helix transcriptional regulator [Latilactobacillus fragifolii]
MELCQELIILSRNISQIDRYLFKQCPISSAGYLIITALSANKTATSSQLSETLKISKPTVRHYVKVLSSKGYISNLGYNLDNHPSLNLVLTASGTQLLKEVNTSIQRNNHQLFKETSDRQINQLIKDLRTLNFSLAVIESNLANN